MVSTIHYMRTWTAPCPQLPKWISGFANSTLCVAWGDVDGDGDLDLACGNFIHQDEYGFPFHESNTLYENVDGSLSLVPEWESDTRNETFCLAWGDMDGDGDLDLVCGNRVNNTIYENTDGSLTHPPCGPLKWT